MFTAALAACGSTLPPQELVSARNAYAHAAAGKAAQLQPTQLYEAKQALDSAEAKFKDEGDSPDTTDLAYVAQRKAEIAEAQTDVTLARQAYQQADKDMRALTGKQLENDNRSLRNSRPTSRRSVRRLPPKSRTRCRRAPMRIGSARRDSRPNDI